MQCTYKYTYFLRVSVVLNKVENYLICITTLRYKFMDLFFVLFSDNANVN